MNGITDSVTICVSDDTSRVHVYAAVTNGVFYRLSVQIITDCMVREHWLFSQYTRILYNIIFENRIL